MKLTYQRVALLSLPVIVANVTLPIQGLIDVAVIGHLDSPDYLSAVGLATQLFSLLLVSFNFLQYASSGLSAQAVGAQDDARLQRVLLRALLLATVIGALLIAGQALWQWLGDWYFAPSERIASLLHDYLAIRIWGAPFELANYAFIGWFVGQARPRCVLRQQLLISVSNMLFNVIFVIGLNWNVSGVALGTLLANMLGTAYALSVATRTMRARGQSWHLDWARILQRAEMLKLLRLNRDIWIRTTLLTLSFSWIMRLSAQQGELTLASNVILLQLLTLCAFAIDGIAVTTEGQVGQVYGRRDTPHSNNYNKLHTLHDLHHVVKVTTISAVLVAVLISACFFTLRPLFLALMTDISAVANRASQYYHFAAFIPVVAVMAYQFDGVMFGLTANRIIRNSMVGVAAIFFPLSYGLSHFGNTGVWLSLYAFFLLRGGILMWQYRHMRGGL